MSAHGSKPCQYLVLSASSTLAILVDILQQHLVIILICISLVNNDAEPFSICLLAISSFLTCLFKSFVHFPKLLEYNLLNNEMHLFYLIF